VLGFAWQFRTAARIRTQAGSTDQASERVLSLAVARRTLYRLPSSQIVTAAVEIANDDL